MTETIVHATTQKILENIDDIFKYVTSNTYPENFTRSQKKDFRVKCKKFSLQDGDLYYQNRKGHEVRVITNIDERKRIVQACHEGLGETSTAKALGGHFGRDKSQRKVSDRYYWPGLANDVAKFIQQCDICQRVQAPFKKTKAPLQNINITAEPWQQIGIDLLGPLPETKEGYKYIGYTPFYLLYGRHPRLPLEAGSANINNETTTSADLETTIEQMTKIREIATTEAMENIKKAQIRQKRNYDKRQNFSVFEPGQKVLLKVMRNNNRVGGKLDARWTGPYEIGEIVKDNVYRLKNKTGRLLKSSVNVTRLKGYTCPAQSDQDICDSNGSDSSDHSGDDDLQVLKVTNDGIQNSSIQSVNLTDIERRNLHKGEWLSDNHINMAQILLKNKFPICDGLKNCAVFQSKSFDIPINEFVQILNSGGNHWITVSTIGCSPGTIEVYDSLMRSIPKATKLLLKDLTQCENLKVIMPECTQQTNSSDCGLFAIANAFHILNGDIVNKKLCSRRMRLHVANCFTKGYLTEFPTDPKARMLKQKCVKL